MKKLFLAIALGSLIAFTSNSFGSEVYNDSTKPTEIKKEFNDVLSAFFGHDLILDPTLKESCEKFVEKEVDGKEIVKGENYAYFHQMWTLSDPLESYKHEDLVKSFDKMIHQDVYKNYFSRMEGESYWVEVIKKGDKYYLVVAVN